METKPELCCAFLQRLDAIQDRPDVDPVQFLILYEFGRVAMQCGQREVAAPWRLMSLRLRVPQWTYKRKLWAIPPDLLMPTSRKGRRGGNLYDVAYLGNLLNGLMVSPLPASQPKEWAQDEPIPGETMGSQCAHSEPMGSQCAHSEQAQETVQVQSAEEVTAKWAQNEPISPTPIEESIYCRDTYSNIDRFLTSKPKDHEKADLERGAQHMRACMEELSGRLWKPPDDYIVAQLLAIDPSWERLEATLRAIARQKNHITAGSRYPWLVTVVIQRIHGFSSEDIRQRREELKRKPPQPEIGSNREFAEEAIRTLAAGIGMPGGRR